MYSNLVDGNGQRYIQRKFSNRRFNTKAHLDWRMKENGPVTVTDGAI